jgi:DNA-binding Xre family transcriptional regulator
MATLIALCDILECTPNDLIESSIVEASAKKVSGEVVPLP